MVSLCQSALTFGSILEHQARTLQRYGAPVAAAALSVEPVQLPPLHATGPGGLDRTKLESIAALYMYAELETSGLMQLAELVVEQRVTLPIRDRELSKLLEDFATAQRGGWYDDSRRAQVFQQLFGFSGARDFRKLLRLLSTQLSQMAQARTNGDRQYAARGVGMVVEAVLTDMDRRQIASVGHTAQILNRQLRSAVAVLGHPGLHQLYQARDMWSLIEKLAVSPGGVPPKVSDIVRRAQTGQFMLRWLAEHLATLRAQPTKAGDLAAATPALFNHADMWLVAAASLTRQSPAPQNPQPYPAAPTPSYRPPGGGWA
ncbi:hypothetical protein [uncultured Tateyamaria sp.]|uniref:hypothetical protein n=1 Tax=Tateyamaria sp. 1078 TaxID=3417464 RepID=UPI00263A1639|nr:hypothetical protein [uncultured Tateyamaria sp.]